MYQSICLPNKAVYPTPWWVPVTFISGWLPDSHDKGRLASQQRISAYRFGYIFPAFVTTDTRNIEVCHEGVHSVRPWDLDLRQFKVKIIKNKVTMFVSLDGITVCNQIGFSWYTRSYIFAPSLDASGQHCAFFSPWKPKNWLQWKTRIFNSVRPQCCDRRGIVVKNQISVSAFGTAY